MVISSMISALLFGVACWYPEKVWAVGEAGKGSAPYILPLQRVIDIDQGRGDARAVDIDEISIRSANRLSTHDTDQHSLEAHLIPMVQRVSEELREMIDTLPLTERRLFLTLMDDPITAALLMMAAQHPRFVDTIRHFRLMPEEVQQAYWASQHTMRGAVSNTPKSYRALVTVADVEEMPLSMSLAESVARTLYDSNTLYLSYLFLNLLIWTGSGFASAVQGGILPLLWHRGAVATVQASNIEASCDLVMAGQVANPEVFGDLVGLDLSSVALFGSACAGLGIATLPTIAQNIFMPLVMTGVLSAMKLYYGIMERHNDRALYWTELEELGNIIRLLEQRLGDVDVEQLVLTEETRAILAEVAQKPGELLPIAVGISRLPAEEFEEVSTAVIAITQSLHNHLGIDEDGWQTTLSKLLHIEPHQGQPRTSGIFNALHHMFADRNHVRVYAPLVLGFILAATLQSGAAISLGVMAPHIAILGDGATGTIIPEVNMTALCQNLNLTGSAHGGVEVTGTIISSNASSLGTILNIFASSFLVMAMSNLYSPIQRLLTNRTVRGWTTWLASLRSSRAIKDAEEEEKMVLLQQHEERMHNHTTRQLRRRTASNVVSATSTARQVSQGSAVSTTGVVTGNDETPL